MREFDLEVIRQLIRVAFGIDDESASDREWLGERVQSGARAVVPLPPYAFQQSRVIKAVYALPSRQNAWIRFAYAPATLAEWANEVSIAELVWAEFAPSLKAARAKTLKAAKALAFFAQRDYRTRDQGRVTVAQLAVLAGVSEANWYRDWQPRWLALQSILTQMDEQALRAVRSGMSRHPPDGTPPASINFNAKAQKPLGTKAPKRYSSMAATA